MNKTNTNRPLHNFSLFTISFSLLLMFTSVASADFSRDGDIVTDSVTKLEWQGCDCYRTFNFTNHIFILCH